MAGPSDKGLKTVALIPARMGSSRFPGKPVAPILGKPMIEWVYKNTAACPVLSETYVATCDEVIRDVVASFGGRSIMTSPRHERASDRIAEAAEMIDADIIVMVQGDEPMVSPDMIEAAVRPMVEDQGIACVNLMRRITDRAEIESRDTIKVVTDLSGDALFFSREPIPSVSMVESDAVSYFKQVCIIPFRKDALRRYAGYESTPLEKVECIDMLRFLENGIRVRMVETDKDTYAVDRPQDILNVEKRMRAQGLVKPFA